jgi:hypothetical protein
LPVNDLTWRKSTYSSGSGGECVEVATWRKSTYSDGQGGNCVEVAVARAVFLRDTTDRAGATLTVPAFAWTAFVAAIRES